MRLTCCWFCSLGDLIFSSFSARVAMVAIDLQAAREVRQGAGDQMEIGGIFFLAEEE